MCILADECENCGRAAYAFCTECDNSYCQACITMRHKVIHRRRHTITRLSVMNKADLSTVAEDKPIIIDGMCHQENREWQNSKSETTEGKDAWIETLFDDVTWVNLFHLLSINHIYICLVYTTGAAFDQRRQETLSYWSVSYRCPYANCCTDPEEAISRAEGVTGHNICCWIQSWAARSWVSSNPPQWLKPLGGFHHAGTRRFTIRQQIYRRSASGCAQSAAAGGVWVQCQEGAFSKGEATGGGKRLWLFCNHQLLPALQRRRPCQTQARAKKAKRLPHHLFWGKTVWCASFKNCDSNS